eukprot:GHVN01018482.1.p1 GENE.GHVN01018482.1~~GHVN01018482.1.p1  ORF type:complete len:725 (-),score=6.08 GHVN01018482.1:263-2143(-)
MADLVRDVERCTQIQAYNTLGDACPDSKDCPGLVICSSSRGEYPYSTAQIEKMFADKATKEVMMANPANSRFDVRALLYKLGFLMAKQSVFESLEARFVPGNASESEYKRYIDFHADVLCWHPMQVNQLSMAYTCVDSPGSAYVSTHLMPENNSVPTILMGLLCSFGISVFTDMAVINPNGQLNMVLPTGEFLVRGLVHTWGWLLDYSATGGCLTDSMFAWISGLHQAGQVVPHHEGSDVFSGVLSHYRAARPRGVFAGRFDSHVGFASQVVGHTTDRMTLAAQVDNVLLTTAALVALADPGITGPDGAIVPTVYSAEAATPDDEVVDDQAQRLQAAYRLFASEYARKLGMMLNDPGNSHMKVADLLCRMCDDFADEAVDCQTSLDYRVLAPHFWVEPMHLLADLAPKIRNEEVCPIWAGGFGKYSKVPLFAEVSGVEEVGERVIVSHRWRSYRHNGIWLIYSPRAHREGGTQYIRQNLVRPFASATYHNISQAIVLPGHDVIGNLEAASWGRGMSAVPHPAEAACVVDNQMQWTWECTSEAHDPAAQARLPDAMSVRDETVTFSVGRLSASRMTDKFTQRICRVVSDGCRYLSAHDGTGYGHIATSGYKTAADYFRESKMRVFTR